MINSGPIRIFEEKLGYNPIYFSYPFGEYSLDFIDIVKQNFNFAFGQHSGVIDLSKDNFQLPRFPINETATSIKIINHSLPNPRDHEIINKEN